MGSRAISINRRPWCSEHTFKRVPIRRIHLHWGNRAEDGDPTGQDPGLQRHPSEFSQASICLHWRLRRRPALPAGGGCGHCDRIKHKLKASGLPLRGFLCPALPRFGEETEASRWRGLPCLEGALRCSLYSFQLGRSTCFHPGPLGFISLCCSSPTPPPPPPALVSIIFCEQGQGSRHAPY